MYMSIEQDMLNKQETSKVVEVNQSTAKVEVSEEEKQAKTAIIEDRKIEDGKKIEELRNELMGKQEKNEFGESHINNPRILDLIADIEFFNIEEEGLRDQAIERWKIDIKKQYEEAVKDFNKYKAPGLIYGKGGYDRFLTRDGKVYLKPGEPDPESPTVKHAIMMGMEIEYNK